MAYIFLFIYSFILGYIAFELIALKNTVKRFRDLSKVTELWFDFVERSIKAGDEVRALKVPIYIESFSIEQAVESNTPVHEYHEAFIRYMEKQ